jgi:hypothetical protein
MVFEISTEIKHKVSSIDKAKHSGRVIVVQTIHIAIPTTRNQS